METRRNGELKRSILSTLAAMVAAAVPSLVASPALADKTDASTADAKASTADAKASTDAPAKQGDKPAAKKTAAPKAAKARAKDDAAAKSAKKDAPKAAPAKKDAKVAHAAAPKSKKTKKTASRTTTAARKKTAKKADKEAPKVCFGPTISIDRGGLEAVTLPVVDCHAHPIESSREALSVLARPWGAQKPVFPHPTTHQDPKGRKIVAPPRVPGLLDSGLLVRLDAIARRFPGRPISLVSGYRPQSRGSQHQSARALDLRVAGVSNEELVAFCKTLKDTGCGYYPNSSFVHVDVRNPGTGVVTWIDASGPGEAPHYVKQWPPPPEPSDLAVLPPDGDPHDGARDPWARDPPDAPEGAPAAKDPFDEL
jgi:hypothetical protein